MTPDPHLSNFQRETGLNAQREQLCDLIQSLNSNLQNSADLATTHDEAPSWADLSSSRTGPSSENPDVSTSFERRAYLQEATSKTRQADCVMSWTDSALSFDQDVVMVDTPAKGLNYGEDQGSTCKRLPGELQHEVTHLRQRRAETGDSPARLTVEPLPTGYLRSIQPPINLTGFDLRGHKESSAARRSEATHANLNLNPTKLEAVRPSKAGLNGPTGRPRKKPPKRGNKSVPPLEMLVKELTGLDATKRIRRHVLASARATPALPGGWNKQRDWDQQTREVLNLAHEKSTFDKLVALTLKAYGVERIYIKARAMLDIDSGAPDPNLPTAVIDKLAPGLREKRSPDGFRRWLTLVRKLIKLCDWLPYMPLNGNGTVDFQHFVRLANEDIDKLRERLDRIPRAQRLAKIGRAFRYRILKIESFLWEDISVEGLSKLPSHTLLHLLTTRRGDRMNETWNQDSPEAKESHHVSKQCDVCEDERCSLVAVAQDLASNQSTSEQTQVLCTDPVAQHDEAGTQLSQKWESETSSSDPMIWQISDDDPFVVLQTMAETLLSQPLLHLSTPRRIPDTAQAVAFAMHGNVKGLQGLLSAGQASVRDESYTRGFSLLRWALYGGHSGMHNYEIVRFLLDNGAYVDDECYNTVEYFRLRKMYSSADTHALSRIKHQDRNWFEEQDFPLIHQIIFGMCAKPLSHELSQNPDAIFSTDAHGRTALDWAAARAQLDDMRLLISRGSNPNSMDATGRTTILHTVDSSSVEALRLVLEAGAQVDPRMPEGRIRGSPLTSASLNSLPEMVELLVKFGADLNAPNPEDLTALHSAAVAQNAKCASILLDHGADLDYVPNNGRTPIMTAIIHNSHSVLRLFLDRSCGRIDGSQLLPVIAEYADLETMSILTSHHSFNLIGSDVAAGRAKLFFRRDNNDRLSHAFEGLVSETAWTQKNTSSPGTKQSVLAVPSSRRNQETNYQPQISERITVDGRIPQPLPCEKSAQFASSGSLGMSQIEGKGQKMEKGILSCTTLSAVDPRISIDVAIRHDKTRTGSISLVFLSAGAYKTGTPDAGTVSGHLNPPS